MDLNEIKNYYQNLDDDVLLKIATKEIESLRKEVIPILEAELKKRNLSITDKPTYSKEQFNDPFAKEKLYYSDEYSEYFTSDNSQVNNLTNRKFYIKKNLLFLIAFLFSIIGFLLLKNFTLISGTRLIILSIILLFIIKMILSKLKIGEIAEVKPKRIIISKYPIGNFNIFRILILVQIAMNGLKKIEIPFNSITKLYQKNTLTNKGYYIETFNVNQTKKSYRIFIEVLSNKDREELLEIIKLKIIESKNLQQTK